MRKGAPFADYDDFDDCTSKNSEKDDPSAYCGEIKHRTEDKTSRRKKQAWTGWGPAQENRGHTRKAGWDWDNHLLAYTSNAPRQFECNCGEQLEVPGYHNCRCGKIWNGYVIGTGGDNHEASAEKFLVREVAVRPDVIVANRREAFGEIPHDPHGGQPEANLTWHPTQTLIKEHQTGTHPWHGDIGRELGWRANHDDNDAVHYLQHVAKRLGYADPFGDVKPLSRNRIHEMHADRESWHADDDIPFPSDHKPKTPELGATPEDWHSRVPNGQWSSNPAPRRKTKRKTVNA